MASADMSPSMAVAAALLVLAAQIVHAGRPIESASAMHLFCPALRHQVQLGLAGLHAETDALALGFAMGGLGPRLIAVSRQPLDVGISKD
jgi:hypothetical protein